MSWSSGSSLMSYIIDDLIKEDKIPCGCLDDDMRFGALAYGIVPDFEK